MTFIHAIKKIELHIFHQFLTDSAEKNSTRDRACSKSPADSHVLSVVIVMKDSYGISICRAQSSQIVIPKTKLNLIKNKNEK